VIYTGVTAPRRAAARAILQGAIDRGDLPPGLDLELATDLLIALLAFRMLVIQGRSDDEYLEALINATEAGAEGGRPLTAGAVDGDEPVQRASPAGPRGQDLGEQEAVGTNHGSFGKNQDLFPERTVVTRSVNSASAAGHPP
jgi:hypothetical protein